jgi:hypothetical protein
MPAITSFTASLGYNGLIDVFAVSDPSGTGATVWRARQQSAGGHWSAWVSEDKPGSGAYQVRSILDPGGHGHVLANSGNGQLWFKERGWADDFSLWEDLGAPAAAPEPWGFIWMWGVAHPDGRVDVVATANTDTDRGIFYRSRPAGGTAWADWLALGDNDFVADIVAAVDHDGSLEIATLAEVPAQAADGTTAADGATVNGMSHRRQQPDGTWTAWATLGPQVAGGFTGHLAPVAPIGPEGNVRLLAVATTSPQLWQDPQNASHAFFGWEDPAQPSGVITGLAAATGADGGIDLCVTRHDNTVAHSRHVAGSGWSPWAAVAAPGPGTIASPTLILDAQNCLNLLLARPGQDGLLMLRQQTENGPFVPGPALPALPPH